MEEQIEVGGSDGLSMAMNVIRIDQEHVRGYIDRVVRSSVEDTINALLDAEAKKLCNVGRYGRSGHRRDYRAGHYKRQLPPRPAW